MAEADRFETWVVSSFNLVVLSLVVMLAGHASGALEGSLSGFGTLPGVVVFGYLWALTFGATHWALKDGGLGRIREGEFGSLLLHGVAAGALIGVAFLLGVLLVVLVVNILEGGVQLISFALFALFGGMISSIVGGLIGGVAVVLDVALYAVTTHLFEKPAIDESEETPN